LKLFIALL